MAEKRAVLGLGSEASPVNEDPKTSKMGCWEGPDIRPPRIRSATVSSTSLTHPKTPEADSVPRTRPASTPVNPKRARGQAGGREKPGRDDSLGFAGAS
ncbi:hypothetical protein N7462_002709 [Penicillium macrosclerotiorum]|uniref:uncharacterized protein n=1 Tax=Penicillium macrosclerotiorum TaxID=303699 RepID=UPI0025473534|nr:uncharacterized protein N7462_002709 [Penicillium macrosclerotiorum]KAJ5693286.1 hypothetical protein N7462_002709 [Penicillium macrosclerotiorum]